MDEKFTKEDLIKAIDEVIQEIEDDSDLEDKEDVKVNEDIKDNEEVKKAEDEDADDNDDNEDDKEDGKKKKKKKKKDGDDEGDVKKTVEISEDELNVLKKAQSDLVKIEKTIDEGNDLKKAFSKIESLEKSLKNLKETPMEKKSVDGLEIIQKGETIEDPKTGGSLLKSLSKNRVAEIMHEDLILKGVEGIKVDDVCQYEATGTITDNYVLNKTIEAINKRAKDGLL